MYGIHKSENKQKNLNALEEFMIPFEFAYFDENACNHYGEIRAYLEKKRIIIGSLDMMIAAHARSLNAILVTNNVKEFNRVPHLTIENWVK